MRTFVVKPRKAGLWVVTAAALLAGWLKSEIALMAAGAFLALLAAYSLAAALVLACAHRRRAASLRVRIHPAVLDAGGRAALCLEQPASFWQLPACLVRYRLALRSADGRRVAARFPPEIFAALPCEFPVQERGAFFAAADFLEIFDCFGFWTARLTLVREEAARLCVTVPPLELPAAARAQHGG
ncbi:MAG: hypothetical protein LBC72_04430, partial [Spirochaetaceae bacterium]|nr:hypothetical protein [Spirochaetaceae bacterium]